MWVQYIDGISFRKLGDEHNLTHQSVYERVKKELKQLPNNTKLTYKHCSRYCGVFVCDGKYVKVRGYEKKIPFIYGIDYLTHDIPLGILFPSENYIAYLKFFKILNLLNYPLRIVACDDVFPLKLALNQIYPRARIQLCNNHYLENIRRILSIRTEEKYHDFFYALKKYVFDDKQKKWHISKRLNKALSLCKPSDNLAKGIAVGIFKRHKELFAYRNIPNCPRTTNIIEAFNSHLQGRLKSIKGFESFESAQTFLNAYLIRRRTKPFTDCKGKFKKLNGKTSLQKTLKKQTKLPEFY